MPHKRKAFSFSMSSSKAKQALSGVEVVASHRRGLELANHHLSIPGLLKLQLFAFIKLYSRLKFNKIMETKKVKIIQNLYKNKKVVSSL
jgi:hypothetical protein